MLTDKQAAAYLAGIIDGEGSIGLSYCKNGNKRRWFTISNSDKDILDAVMLCLTQLGIRFKQPKEQKGSTFSTKPCYVIEIDHYINFKKILELVPLQCSRKKQRLEDIVSSYQLDHPNFKRMCLEIKGYS